MSLASETRRAVDEHPFLVAALRAGIVNYTAAARFLDVDGDLDAVATAIRRYAEELPAYETEARDVRVRMESGIRPIDGHRSADALLTVGRTSFAFGGGDLTGIVATGAVDPAALTAALRRLSLEGIEPTAAGVSDGSLVVVVDRLEGANALRAVEAAFERVPRA